MTYIHRWLSPIFLATALFFATGCEDELVGDTGLDVLPLDEQVEIVYTDTLRVTFETVRVDSVNSANAPAILFGNYLDPQFGRITANTYMEVGRPDSVWDTENPQNIIFDSLVLRLDVVDSYGRFDYPSVFTIYELADSLPDSDQLNSTLSFQLKKDLELSNGFTANLREDSTERDFRIRLNDALGRRIMGADLSTLTSDAAFRRFFRGFFIGTQKSGFITREPGVVYRVNNGSNSTTTLLLYYKERTSLTEFTNRLRFFPLTSAKKFTQFSRTEAGDKLLNAPQDPPHTYEFIADGNLIEIHGDFPSIENLGRESGINDAQFIVSVDTTLLGSKISGTQNAFQPPSSMQIIFLDQDGEEYFPELLNRLEISYNAETGQYVFPLANYLQAWVSGSVKIDKFILRTTQSNFSVARAIIGGVNHPTLAPKLQLTYTRRKLQ